MVCSQISPKVPEGSEVDAGLEDGGRPARQWGVVGTGHTYAQAQ